MDKSFYFEELQNDERWELDAHIRTIPEYYFIIKCNHHLPQRN